MKRTLVLLLALAMLVVALPAQAAKPVRATVEVETLTATHVQVYVEVQQPKFSGMTKTPDLRINCGGLLEKEIPMHWWGTGSGIVDTWKRVTISLFPNLPVGVECFVWVIRKANGPTISEPAIFRTVG